MSMYNLLITDISSFDVSMVTEQTDRIIKKAEKHFILKILNILFYENMAWEYLSVEIIEVNRTVNNSKIVAKRPFE